MQELPPRFLQVGDTLTEESSGAQYEIGIITNKGNGKFAICIKTTERAKYFRRELCRNNGVWKTCLKGDKFDAFILNEKAV